MTEVVTFPQDALNCHNLTVLQRLDPAIKSIVTKCSHAVIYYYLDDQWRTSDVKGSLFVVQRQNHPTYQAIVLNQTNTNDVFISLSGAQYEQMQDPLIICLKTENKEIIGVWVYDKTEQEQLIETIENIINSDKNGTENNAEPQNDNRFIDLLSGKSRDGIPMATFGRMSSSSVPAGFPAEMYPPNMFPFNGFPPGPRPGPFAPVSHPPGPLPFPPGMFPAVYPNKLSNPNPNFPSAPSGPNFPSANFGSAPMNFTHGPNNPHPNALFPHPPATYGNAPTASDLHSIESQFHLPPHSAGKHVFSPQLPPASDILKNSITNLLNPTEILSKSGLLTPTSISNNRSSNSIPLNLANGGLLNPEKLQANIYDSHKITPTHIRNALLRLANNDIFINTLYQELMRDFS